MRDIYDPKKRPVYPRRPDKIEPPNMKKPDSSQPKPELRLATAYIPNQPYVGLVPLQEGFHRGSMFPNLYQPYHDWRRN
jgi:hypothetical protein